MVSGIRATVRFGTPEGCPIARVAEETGAVVDRTATSVAGRDRAGTTEFTLSGAVDPATVTAVEGVGDAVFPYGTATVYRARDHGDGDCPCVCLGEFDCPVHRYVADGDGLTLVFHAPGFERLQAVMGALRERYPDVDVQRLLRPPLEGRPDERVFVNPGRLTDRQREALRTAYDMGYFERPKGANASEVAAELGITGSTFTEHLVTAQRKLLADVFEDG